MGENVPVMTVDVVLSGGTIVTPSGLVGPNVGIAVNDGVIVSVGYDDDLPNANTVYDCEGQYIAPGIVDCHVHTREPGYESRDDWEHVTRSAAAGGVTTIIAMPNTDPVVDCPENLQLVYDLIEEKSLIDAQSYGLLGADNVDQLRPMAEAGAVGFKCFLMTGDQYQWSSPNDGQLIRAMEEVASIGRRVGFHEENAEIVNHFMAEFQEAGKNEAIWHARAAAPIAEVEAITRLCLFSEYTGCPVHMFHESSGSGAEVVLRAKQQGVDVTAETMPHYLQLSTETLEAKGSAARVNPPLRDADEVELLWKVGIEQGAIDCIATDHAPYTDDEKGMDDPFQSIWNTNSGFVGVETQVPAMLTLVNEGRISYSKWIRMHSQRPAEIWGLYPRKGAIQVGSDADVIVFDPTTEWTLDRHDLRSKTTVTPYDGERFVGKVTKTFVRGEMVFDGDEITQEPGFGRVVETT